MSNSKKITELTSYTAAEVQSTDPLFITDLTNQETKKITSLDFATYAINAKSSSIYSGSYNGRFTGSFSGSYVGNLTGTASYATTASYALSGGTGGSSGEVNTASNTGSAGVGVFFAKTGVDLSFKKIRGSTNISVVDNSITNTIDVDILGNTNISPGGPAGSVQFNSSANTFSGTSNFSWDTLNNKLSVVGGISSTSFTSSISNAIGFVGTASYSSASLSSSYALTSSYSVSSSNAISSSYAGVASSLVGGIGASVVSVLNNGGAYYSFPIYSVGYTSDTSYITINHGLGRVPYMFKVVAVCVNAGGATSRRASDGVYVADYNYLDEIELTNFLDDNGSEGLNQDTHIPFSVTADSTSIYINNHYWNSVIIVMSKKLPYGYRIYTTSATPSSYLYLNDYWKLKAYVI